MISMTCACKGEFWVRDRLAGTSTPCPSCGVSLAVPSLETVPTSMSPATCSCGEIFWSSAWHPGKLTRCPICGDVVGPEKSEGATTAIIPPGAGDPPGPALRAQAGPGHPACPPSQSGERDAAVRTTAASTREAPPASGPMGRGRKLALSGAGALLLAAGVLLGARLAGTPGQGESAPPLASPGEGGGTPPGADTEPPPLPVDRASSAPLKILVPAYFYPGASGLDDWKRLIASAGRVPIVAVVNPASGPGDAPMQDYTNVIRGGTATRGLTMVGYVNTGFAARSRQEIEAEIDRWSRFYPEIQGIFLDAQSEKAEDVAFYRDLRDHARRTIDGALVVTNPGLICAEEYFRRGATDLAVVFENAGGFGQFDLPLWRLRYRPDQFAALPHGVPSAEEMEDAVRRAGGKGVGYIFVTDGEMPNPWERLPPYWDELVDAVEEINAASPDGRPVIGRDSPP